MKGKEAKELHSMGMQLQETGKAMCQMAYAMGGVEEEDDTEGLGEMSSDGDYSQDMEGPSDDKSKRVKLAMIRLKKA